MPRPASIAASLLAVLVAGACGATVPASLPGAAGPFTEQIALPPPDTTGSMPLEQAIAQRRSNRDFAATPLPMASIGQLLWAGQGITGPDGKRAAPSAGALYPLVLYVVTPTRVLRYRPDGHRVDVRDQSGVRSRLSGAAHGQQAVGTAPDVIVIAAAPQRTRVRYGDQAQRFIDLEAGHVAENILLQATASGLAAVPVGSFDPVAAARAVGLPPDQTVVYLVPVGRRP